MYESWLLSACFTWVFLIAAAPNYAPWFQGGRLLTKLFSFKPWIVTGSHDHAGF